MEPVEKDDLRNSMYDGMFSNMFATLTGGVFLTGFALYLGMDELMIGLLASMPFLVTIFQLPTSYLIAKNGKRKKMAYGAAAIARLIWIPVLLVALLPVSATPAKALAILSLILLSYAFVSVSYVSWLSWMSDLVPDKMRGSFFGTRNMLCGAAGMVVMVVFGKFMDYLNGHSFGSLPIGFGITFMMAIFFGMLSLCFLKKISEPPAKKGQEDESFRKHITLPFKEPNFRKFLTFAFLWNFSVYFASPFFTLYFLRDLEFSYGFVAALGMLSAFADLTGMHIWGRISDTYKNKPVIQIAAWVPVFLPLAWITVRSDSIVIPVILHVVGGGFWAGINLCTNNLLLRISPHDNKAWFLSVFNILGGLGAAIAPILAGLILKAVLRREFQLFSYTVLPLHVIFAISAMLRLSTFQIFRYVHEPEAVSVGKMVRMLRSIRGLNMANGFNHILHPFIEIEGKDRWSEWPRRPSGRLHGRTKLLGLYLVVEDVVGDP